jgi:hypothetical protein
VAEEVHHRRPAAKKRSIVSLERCLHATLDPGEPGVRTPPGAPWRQTSRWRLRYPASPVRPVECTPEPHDSMPTLQTPGQQSVARHGLRKLVVIIA